MGLAGGWLIVRRTQPRCSRGGNREIGARGRIRAIVARRVPCGRGRYPASKNRVDVPCGRVACCPSRAPARECALSPDQILPFALFALVTSITPGPNNVMLTAIGANFGFARGLPCAFGVSVGFSLMLALMIAGPGTLILASPEVLDVVRWLGVAFLLWLAWKVATAEPADTAARRRPVGFLGAAAFQWINPKAWLIVAGATAAYLDQAAPALEQSAAMGAMFFLACVPSCLVWLGFGAVLQRLLLRAPARLRAFNVAMALLLVGSVALFVA